MSANQEDLFCASCGANWSAGQFSTDCEMCGGGALVRDCVVCGGRCAARWRRAVMDSIDLGVAHWHGACLLSRDEQFALMREQLDRER